MEINGPHSSKKICVEVQLILKFHIRFTIHSMVKKKTKKKKKKKKKKPFMITCGYELLDLLFCYLWWQHYVFPLGTYLALLSVHALLVGLGHVLENDWCQECQATIQNQGDTNHVWNCISVVLDCTLFLLIKSKSSVMTEIWNFWESPVRALECLPQRKKGSWEREREDPNYIIWAASFSHS